MRYVIVHVDNRVSVIDFMSHSPEKFIQILPEKVDVLRQWLNRADPYKRTTTGKVEYLVSATSRRPLINVNGTDYHRRTDPTVVAALEDARLHGTRIRLIYRLRESGVQIAPLSGYIKRYGTWPLIARTMQATGKSLFDDYIDRIEYANKNNGGVIYQKEADKR